MYKCVVKVAGRGGVNQGELAEETQHNLNLDTGCVCSQRPWKIWLLSTSLPHRLCCLMTPTKTLCPSHSDILMASQRSPIVSAFVPLHLQFPPTDTLPTPFPFTHFHLTFELRSNDTFFRCSSWSNLDCLVSRHCSGWFCCQLSSQDVSSGVGGWGRMGASMWCDSSSPITCHMEQALGIMPVDSKNGHANFQEELSQASREENSDNSSGNHHLPHSLELPDSFLSLAPPEGLSLNYCHGIIIHVMVLWSVFVCLNWKTFQCLYIWSHFQMWQPETVNLGGKVSSHHSGRLPRDQESLTVKRAWAL